MAAISDSASTGGRGRAHTGGIVVGGDRTLSRALAHRHSRHVRALRVVLPLAAIATLGAFAMSVLGGVGFGTSIPDLAVPQIIADNLKMKNPHYEGFNADGGRYWVQADTAQQDLKSLALIHLEGITGELTDAKKQKTNLVATRGVFDNKANVLDLFDSINVTGESGLTATLTRATVKTKEGIITSDQPSKIVMGAGEITSNRLVIRQRTKEYTFVDSVHTHIKPKEPAPQSSDKAASQAMPFGKPGEPIDVEANRLDIDDNKRVALYTGGVVATQAGSKMTAPEMTVIYEGEVAPQSQGAQKAPAQAPDADAGTKLKQIIAKDSVVLEQPSGETATGRTAQFDTATQVAVIEGDVVLTQGADKKAVGDRAEYDQTAQTMVLTGPVVVTQGPNVLKGRRLVYYRSSDKMQLTSPGGNTGGRIFAHFIKPDAKPEAAASDDQQAGAGISFGAAFKTDPNAPYDIQADRLDVDNHAKTALFTGNVVTVQGESTIRAQEMTAFYTGDAGMGAQSDASKGAGASLNHIKARKAVSITSKDGQTATGDWAEVDVKSNLATVGGAVVLTQGNNIVRGTKLVIDMTTGEATIKTEPAASGSAAMISSSGGDGDGQIIKAERPSAVFYPGQLTGDKKTKSPAKTIDAWEARTSP